MKTMNKSMGKIILLNVTYLQGHPQIIERDIAFLVRIQGIEALYVVTDFAFGEIDWNFFT